MKLGTVSGLITAPEGADPVLYRIERAKALGLSVIGVFFRGVQDAAYLRQVAESADKNGIELRLGTGARLGSPDPEIRKADVESTIKLILNVREHAGIKFSSVANIPMNHNRWTNDPPMDERIDIIGSNLAAIGDAIAGVGFSIGLENHCDYRGYECAAMLKKANRPNVGAQLDTGNAFTVFEDPMDCALALAPYTISVHFKDVRVTPFAPPPFCGTRTETVPLGAGHVDNEAICAMLSEKAPNPAKLALMVEPLFMPAEEERDAFLAESIAWARKRLARFLD